MRHDPKSFDRSDPDATQALEDALPIVEQLLSERAKPQPKDIDLFRAWRSQISDLEDQVRLRAERAGCSAAELERLAAAKVRYRANNPVQAADGFTLPTGRLPSTRGGLAAEEQLLMRRQYFLESQQRHFVAEHRKIVRRLGKIREKMFSHGAAGLRGRG